MVSTVITLLYVQCVHACKNKRWRKESVKKCSQRHVLKVARDPISGPVNRPAFGGAFPPLYQMSRQIMKCPAILYERTDKNCIEFMR